MRKGDWIQTFTGRQFWPMDPRPEDVDEKDIAHSLSMLCRFAGHCDLFYSVAEHCVLLTAFVPKEDALWALLHDATEAYLVDVPRPIKPFLVGYREAEDAIAACIAKRFGLAPKMPASVKLADYAILSDEMRQNMAPPPARWSTQSEGLGARLRYWAPEEAEARFLARFQDLRK